MGCSSRVVGVVIATAACGSPKPPASAVEPPRLAAESSCDGAIDAAAIEMPVPPRGQIDPYALPTAAWMGFVDGGGFQRATHICDLPDRILVIAAEQGVDGGKRRIGGTVSTIPRTPAARVPKVAIDPGSPGCTPGAQICSWHTSAPAMLAIDTIPNQRVSTSGWVHGADDLCRALPDDTIATCSTATRLAYVEVGCARSIEGPVALELGLHDATLDRRFDLDVEAPVARLVGAAEAASGTTYRYRFRANAATGADAAKGAPTSAVLAFDLAASTAQLEIDGVTEPCLAFGLYRR